MTEEGSQRTTVIGGFYVDRRTTRTLFLLNLRRSRCIATSWNHWVCPWTNGPWGFAAGHAPITLRMYLVPISTFLKAS